MTDLPSILDLLDLEHVEPNLYQSRALYDAPWGMYGGQAAAQALYAAGLTVETDRLPHSLHGYFVRRGNTAKPTVFRVDRDRDGRSFSARRVVAVQDGEVIFSMSASFAAPAGPRQPLPDAEAEPAPDLPPLDSLPAWPNPKHPSFEFRPADAERRLPGHFWIRCIDELPDDPLLHAAVLAYTSDISSALIPFESDGHQHRPEPRPRGLVSPAGQDGRLDLAGADAANRGGRPRLVHRDHLRPRRDPDRERRAGAALRRAAHPVKRASPLTALTPRRA